MIAPALFWKATDVFEEREISIARRHRQFSLRSLFLWTIFSALLIVCVQMLTAAHPFFLLFTFLVTIVFSMFGFGLIVIACCFIVSILATFDEDENRVSNIRECVLLAVVGFIAILPLGLCTFVVALPFI